MKHIMNLQLFASDSPVTGVKKLVYAVMTDEALETYGAVKEAPPLMNIKVSPKSDSAKLYADNDVSEIETSLGDIAVDFETKDMPLEVQADFFGHALDAETGQMVYNSNDHAPYLAIGYQRTRRIRRTVMCGCTRLNSRKFQRNQKPKRTSQHSKPRKHPAPLSPTKMACGKPSQIRTREQPRRPMLSLRLCPAQPPLT